MCLRYMKWEQNRLPRTMEYNILSSSLHIVFCSIPGNICTNSSGGIQVKYDLFFAYWTPFIMHARTFFPWIQNWQGAAAPIEFPPQSGNNMRIL